MEIPCDGSEVSIELIGEGTVGVTADLVKNAAAAVLYYFRVEKGRRSVSVGEFAQALVRVLKGFGLDVDAEAAEDVPAVVAESDLQALAQESGEGFELAFFPLLRHELAAHLERSPRMIRFTGLRSCVKRLARSRRWGRRCQALNDQIVDYMRGCLSRAPEVPDCALVVE